jgi:hypothetical protein
VLSHDRDRELASADRALQLTLFSRDGTAEGPIRLGATWEFAKQPRREAEAQEPVARS